jgi:hypothetical protein
MESKAEVNKKEIPLRTDSSSCEGTAGLVMTGMNLRREETAHQSAASAIATTKPPMMVGTLSQQRQRQEEAEEALGAFGRWRLQRCERPTALWPKGTQYPPGIIPTRVQ